MRVLKGVISSEILGFISVLAQKKHPSQVLVLDEIAAKKSLI